MEPITIQSQKRERLMRVAVTMLIAVFVLGLVAINSGVAFASGLEEIVNPLDELGESIWNTVVSVATIAGIIAAAAGGFMWITGGGKGFEKAKSWFFAAIGGNVAVRVAPVVIKAFNNVISSYATWN